jgi:ATP-dependent Lhr-like helicase
MTISPPSSSDPAKAYELLHPNVQEWVWAQKWQQLRPTQAKAVAPVLAADRDVIISAATASGKTEAAWLPVCSTLAFDAERNTAKPGIKALYISPLKALINDQYDRLTVLGEYIGTPVYRRHGDVGGSDRTAIMKQPDGILLITPESLEALFVHQGSRVPGIFGGLRYIVIDELHSFIGTERGAQLQSLMHRIELAIRRRVVRIGLSATLADLRIAAEFMRPEHGDDAIIIDGKGSDTGELQMQLRGYVRSPEQSQHDDDIGREDGSHDDDTDVMAIAEHIFANLRLKDHLVFANSRSSVEMYADALRTMCEQRKVPVTFHAHHGSLARELREDVERKLKSPETDATAICTSTLEMGIDIGSAESVAQIGPPGSVASLRQRFGRSGRRGGPAILRIYISEPEFTATDNLTDRLRISLVETIATVELMLLDKWYEPPNVSGLHLSTLIQQVLSVIAQHGGATAAQLYSALCGDGPFVHVTRAQFTQLLRDLGAAEVIMQAGDGTLLPGKVGDRLVNHYSFYTAFQTAQEYRLIAEGRPIGTLPIDFPLLVNDFLIFGGRRWLIVDVDETSKVVQLRRAAGGKPPLLAGGRAAVADGIRIRMRELYLRNDEPAYLNATARQLLAEGRQTFHARELDRRTIVGGGTSSLVIAWRGDLILNTLAVMLNARGVMAHSQQGIVAINNRSAGDVRSLLEEIATGPPPDPLELARAIKAKQRDKHDVFLGEDLLTAACAARDLDVPATMSAIRTIVR